MSTKVTQTFVALPWPTEQIVGTPEQGYSVILNWPNRFNGTDSGNTERLDFAPYYVGWRTVPGNIGNATYEAVGNDGNSALGASQAQIDFYRWMRSKNYYVGIRVVGNDSLSLSFVNVYVKTASGGFHAVGVEQPIPYEDDKYFGLAVSVATSFVGGGLIMAAGQANISGNVAGLAAAGAKALAGVDFGDTFTEGTSMFDELDFSDVSGDFGAEYANPFESFDYSSGEGIQAFSDAENVDYGFGADTGGDMSTGLHFHDPEYNYDAAGAAEQVYNDTPESQVSDFGSVRGGTFDTGTIATVAKAGIPIAVKASGPGATKSSETVSNQSGGGGIAKFAQSLVSGVEAGASAIAAVSSNNGKQSTAAQKELAQQRAYVAQLADNRGGFGGMDVKTIAMIGGAILVVALLVK